MISRFLTKWSEVSNKLSEASPPLTSSTDSWFPVHCPVGHGNNMVGTVGNTTVSDHLWTFVFHSWLIKTFLANAFAFFHLELVQEFQQRNMRSSPLLRYNCKLFLTAETLISRRFYCNLPDVIHCALWQKWKWGWEEQCSMDWTVV